MKILITGADGFVGSRLAPRLVASGHEVTAAVLPNAPGVKATSRRSVPARAVSRSLDLLDTRSVESLVSEGWDAVVHLAAVSSGSDASSDPIAAWNVNTLGTVRLCNSLSRLCSSGADPLLLFVSTAEVYGAGDPVARTEADSVLPCSPYAASKLAAEVGVLETSRRIGLRVIIARPFPHTGAGQDERFVVPAFSRRVVEAKRVRARSIKVGNLDPVRDFLHVDDVVDAYVRLLEAGREGEVYNIATGNGVSVRNIFEMVIRAAGYDVEPEAVPELVRPADVPHLVGDSGKLRETTGWSPKLSVEQAIQEVVDAQTD